MFYIFSGLPGTGKSELAQFFSEKLGAVYLRIDTIEQAMRECDITQIDGKGYHVAQKIAADNLKAGLSVIADSVNPLDFTRAAWRNVATNIGKPFCEIEVICSNKEEHKKRIESRQSEVPGLKLPRWEDVMAREYHPWISNPLVIDTAGKTRDQSKAELFNHLLLYLNAH